MLLQEASELATHLFGLEKERWNLSDAATLRSGACFMALASYEVCPEIWPMPPSNIKFITELDVNELLRAVEIACWRSLNEVNGDGDLERLR